MEKNLNKPINEQKRKTAADTYGIENTQDPATTERKRTPYKNPEEVLTKSLHILTTQKKWSIINDIAYSKRMSMNSYLNSVLDQIIIDETSESVTDKN